MSLISDEKQITTNIFIIKEYKKILKSFSFEDEFEKQLNLFYQKIYKINVKSYYNQKELIKKNVFNSESFIIRRRINKNRRRKKWIRRKWERKWFFRTKINYNNYIIKGINK